MTPAAATATRPGWCIVTVVLLWLALGAGPARAALDEDLAALLVDEQLVGLVYATVDGAETRVGAVGQADAARREAMRPGHRVQVGSVAKVVTALGVLRLVSDGRIALDTPLDQVLPGITIENPWAARSPVRVRHLIDMTAGFDDIRLWHFFSTRNTPDQPLARALDGQRTLLRLRTEPGRAFSYSNTSFHLAGMVIEAVAGEAWEHYVDREVLAAIGMRDSTVAFPDATRHAPLAIGHLEDARPVAPIPVAVRPAAQLLTTAADMATLARFLMGDGHVDGRRVIDAALLRAMGRPVTTDAAAAGLPSGYGLGLFTRDRHGAVGLCHGGSVAGWRAMFCLYPASGRAFFAAHNADHEGARYDRFDARFVEELGVASPLPPAPAVAAPVAERDWSGRYVPSPSRLSIATLADHLAGSWRLDLESVPPTLTPAFGVARPLEPLGGGRYRQDDRQQATFALIKTDDGRPALAASHLTVRRIGALELGVLWALTAGAALAIVYFLVAPLWRRRRIEGAWREPGFLATLLLLASGAALALQSWQRLGDATPASLALALASVVLPVAGLHELVRAWRRRRHLPRSIPRVLAAVALVAFTVLLATFGLWPLALWRL